MEPTEHHAADQCTSAPTEVDAICTTSLNTVLNVTEQISEYTFRQFAVKGGYYVRIYSIIAIRLSGLFRFLINSRFVVPYTPLIGDQPVSTHYNTAEMKGRYVCVQHVINVRIDVASVRLVPDRDTPSVA
jgi:hypothetical protein